MTRRRMILATACGALGGVAWAAPEPGPEAGILIVDGRAMEILTYRAPGTGKRPTVLLLHGSRGPDARRKAYDRYARELAGANIATLLFSYFRPDELAATTEWIGHG